jgi:hypothetical protein
VRSQFLKQLEKSNKTSSSVKQRMLGDSEIHCVGITADMQTPAVTHFTTIELTFFDTPEDGSKGSKPKKVDVLFGELDSAADCLLIGFPTMIEWGPYFYNDEDNRPWVEFTKLNISVPAEVPLDG